MNLFKKNITGWRKGGTAMIESYEKPYKKLKNIRVTRASKKSKLKAGTFRNFTTLKKVAGIGEVISGTKKGIKVGDLVKVKKYGWIMRVVDIVESTEYPKSSKYYTQYFLENDKLGVELSGKAGNPGGYFLYEIEKINHKNITGTKRTKGSNYHKDSKSIGDTNSFFDVSVIKDLDDLKQQYRALALKYHPDRGGTTAQMQQVNAEHERLRNLLLSGSSLTDEQKKNEIEIDETFRVIIDQVIHIEGIEVELIGKWLWIGSTLNPERNWQFETPTYNALKSAGLDYIKKQGRPYMVYKGVESKGRGKLTKAEIEAKYGKTKFETKGRKRINSPFKTNNVKLKAAVKRLTKALDKRPV
jgi:hypothetical protein